MPPAWPQIASASVVERKPPWLGLLRPRQGVFGVQVVEVYEDSGAAEAGLAPGDEILFIDGLPVTSVGELVAVVQRLEVGDRVVVRALRRGAELTFRVTLGARVDDRELLHRRLVGKPAPSAALRVWDDERAVDPSALRGRVAVLAWFSTRCDTCASLVSELSRWPELGREAVVFGVTSAEPDRLSAFLSRSAVSVPVAVADDEDFSQYGLLSERADSSVAFIVIDRHGIVRLAAAIDAGEEQEAQATVDDVASAARSLLRTSRR